MSAAQLIGTAVRCDPHQPRPERAASKRRNTAKCGEKCVLRGIFRRRAAAEHTKTQVVRGPLMKIDERVERVEVTGLRATNQIRLDSGRAGCEIRDVRSCQRADSNRVPTERAPATC